MLFIFAGYIWLSDEDLWFLDTWILEGDSLQQISIPRVHRYVGKAHNEGLDLGGGKGGSLILLVLLLLDNLC